MYVVKELWGFGCPPRLPPMGFSLRKRREVLWLLGTGWISELRSKHICPDLGFACPPWTQGLAGHLVGCGQNFLPGFSRPL